MKAFHAYDLRGVYGIDIDCDLAYKVAYFIPRLLNADKVLVGRDMRLSSPQLHEAVVRGICDAGADVWDMGLSSTPLVYYGTAKYGFMASVQITASHNPKAENGLKISREGAMPVGYDTGLNRIERWIEEGTEISVAEVRGKVVEFDIKQEYVDFLKCYIEDISDLKTAFDCSNGMASVFVHQLFGDSPIYLYDTPDGNFPNHDPNPFIPENIVDLQKCVINNRLDVGVIYDGDADRVMFVDETGCFIQPDLIIAMLGIYFVKMKGRKGVVLQDIRSTKSIADYLAPMGCEMKTWRVGRAYAAPKLREIDGLWGGEVAGHYYFRDFFFSDSGLLASIIVLDILSYVKSKGKSFSDVIKKIRRYHNSGEMNFTIQDKNKAMKALLEHFTSVEEPMRIFDFDGYRVEFDQWWFNIRPSNTEPYLRFVCEASNRDMLEDKIAQTRDILFKFK